MATAWLKHLIIYAEVKGVFNNILILEVFIFLLGSLMTHSR